MQKIFPAPDRQPRSKDLPPVAQGSLSLIRPAEQVSLPMELIARQQSLLAAIVLCVQASGLEDKEVYLSLGIDAGHWSRIMKGDAHFPVNKIGDLMDMCGNEAPVVWLARSRGYELVPMETELERQLRAEREKGALLEQENRLMRQLLGR